MIRIVAQLRDGITSIHIEGHEGQAQGGLVCAAVSAITQTALLGLQEIARQYPDLVSVSLKEND